MVAATHGQPRRGSHTGCAPASRAAYQAAGSLGELETIAICHSGMQDSDRPGIDRVQISVFASVAVPLLRMACLLHNQMVTFAEAGVSGALE